jgi:hypothetical protein
MHSEREVGPGGHPFPSQPRAKVFQYEEMTFVGTVGPDAHPSSIIVSALIVSAWAAPAGT